MNDIQNKYTFDSFSMEYINTVDKFTNFIENFP